MESYEKFVDRFQILSKEKNPVFSKGILIKRKCFGEYDAVTSAMLYLKFFDDMVS